MSVLPIIDEFRQMLIALEEAFPESVDDGPANRYYFDLRDQAIAFADKHPVVRQDGRDYGLPV